MALMNQHYRLLIDHHRRNSLLYPLYLIHRFQSKLFDGPSSTPLDNKLIIMTTVKTNR